MARKKKPTDLGTRCPHCNSVKVAPRIRGESYQCNGCGVVYSWITGRKLKSEQKHGMLKPNYSNYIRGKSFTNSGNRTIDIDDSVARMLRNTDYKEMYEIAAETLDVSVRSLKSEYKHLNVGMQRMNLGNRMRKALRAVS